MLHMYTNINAHTLCLKKTDLKIWFGKCISNHTEEFFKIGLLKLANPHTINMKKYRFIGL